MRSRRLLSGLAAALLTTALFGAEVNRSWETLVATLKPGRRVVVVQHGRKQAEGKLLTLTGESITVQAGARPLTIQRDEVFRVRVAEIRMKRSLIGIGIGAAAGVVFGANLGSRRHGLSAMVFGGIGGGNGCRGGRRDSDRQSALRGPRRVEEVGTVRGP